MEGSVDYSLEERAENSGLSSMPSRSSDGIENPSSLKPSPHSPPSRIKQIWAVGGGKGGIGKSLISSSLAIALARMGNKVVAVDLDLGGANLHTTLGVDLPKQTLSDFLNHRVPSIANCLVHSGIPSLELISGAQDALGITNIHHSQKLELLKNLRLLDTDYLVFDLGAGTNLNTIDFFLSSNVGLITVLPEPTSIENAYRFIKSAYYHHLLQCHSLAEIHSLITAAMDPKNPLGIKSPSDLFQKVDRESPEAAMRLKKEIEKFKPSIIVNQARTQTDIEIGNSIKIVCKKYFGIEMDYIGHLDYDSAVWQAVRRKRPLMLEFPNSRLVSSIEKIAQNIVKRSGIKKWSLF